MTIIDEKVKKIMLLSDNQRADLFNVRFNIDFDESSKRYSFYIAGTEITIVVRNIKILREELIRKNGKNINYIKGYFNKKAFDLYIWL